MLSFNSFVISHRYNFIFIVSSDITLKQITFSIVSAHLSNIIKDSTKHKCFTGPSTPHPPSKRRTIYERTPDLQIPGNDLFHGPSSRMATST